MNIAELSREAVRVINNTTKPFPPTISINMPGEWGKSIEVQLAGKNSPTGTIVQSFHGGVTALFDAVDILAYCEAWKTRTEYNNSD